MHTLVENNSPSGAFFSQKKRTIALTGATGFIAQHIIQQALPLGVTFKALTRRPQGDVDGVKWIVGDLHNKDALNELVQNVDGIIHTAGAVKALNWRGFEKANIEGTSNLAYAIINNGNARETQTILLSSMAARMPILSHYARSKKHSEGVMEQILRRHDARPFTILRAPAVYGPHDTEILPLFKALKNGTLYIPGHSDNRFSLIYASDLATAVLSSFGAKQCYGQYFELDDGESNGYKMHHLGDIAEQMLNRPYRQKILTRKALETVALLGDILSSISRKPRMLTRQKVNEMCHPNWVAENNRFNSLNIWQPKISLEKGLAMTLQWYQEKGLI